MADFTYDEAAPDEAEAPAGRRIATLANWAGAAVSLALVAGVAVWGYKLLMRDVTGVPVVMAMEGPMRIAPEDPGGKLAEHQGLAVNDIAGTGLAAPVPDRLMLAPVQPGLSAEDLPQSELPAAAPRPTPVRTEFGAPVLAESAPGSAPDAAQGPEAQPVPRTEDGEVDILALADQIAAGAAPLGDMADSAEDPDMPTIPKEEPVIVTDGSDLFPENEDSSDAIYKAPPPGALARSLRPKTRPGALAKAPMAEQVAALVASQASAGPKDLDPATLPAGTRLAQLGAYDSPETARKEWERFSTRFGEFMQGKDRVIERATSGGRVFYRLRAAGFADLSDARRFCAALVAENTDCIPVTTR
ncbi:SPOR domain-containing protein [Salipiger sp. 1_MG-2023]|uniref:SPOR domain-containing protein n=1 Tax=Salipiger sp. 1_MG-2023 TaxID=3062665 RepID=UPI0026E2F0F6|nr:SPOR domain-containing protein [Salipiger sp. 1_MG-2023]MDO6585775.1 SPOR domain-containing protein [Salipiger sp. 1_MG-2023]